MSGRRLSPASPAGRRDSSPAPLHRRRSPRTSIPRSRPNAAAPMAQARARPRRRLAFHPRRATTREGIRRNTYRAGRVAPARPRSRCDAPRPGNAGGMHSALATAPAILAARTVSCPPMRTSAASQPLAMMRGGSSKRASRARMCAEGSIAVQRRFDARSACPSCPPPAPTSSRSPVCPHALTDKRRHARDIVGAVDRRGVELDGIDRSATPRRFCVALGAIAGPDRSASLPKGTDTTIPAATTRHRELPPSGPSPLRGSVQPVRQHQDTPPAAPARDFRGGRSPGSRVIAADHLPGNTRRSQWHLWSKARRLQLRGQPRHCAKCTHRVPF